MPRRADGTRRCPRRRPERVPRPCAGRLPLPPPCWPPPWSSAAYCGVAGDGRYARVVANEKKLTAGDAELTLRPDQGCRIASLKVGGTELLRQGDKFGAFIMVP